MGEVVGKDRVPCWSGSPGKPGVCLASAAATRDLTHMHTTIPSRIVLGRAVLLALALALPLPHAASIAAAQPTPAAQSRIPASLTDKEFWELTERVSEPGGYFQSDNFLSNEQGYQIIIPQLLQTARQGGVYLGVGPEQNFPYILALKPALAIIFDVRRGNLHGHLLYKALFELSTDRADFLSKLFARPRPDGLSTSSTVRELMAAYGAVAPSESLYQATLKAVGEQLTVKHGFALHAEDLPGIEYVYRTAFFPWGPNLTYNIGGRGGGRGANQATYGFIQSLDDGTGLNRGYLGSEENWRAMKDFHMRNLLVPVVGDFAGPKAIRTVGAYLKEKGAVVSAYYLSNVEQYLNQNGVEQVFLCNVAQLPLDAASTFIYTGRGRYGGGGGGGGLNITYLRPIVPDTQGC
jgi:hypothetical protein